MNTPKIWTDVLAPEVSAALIKTAQGLLALERVVGADDTDTATVHTLIKQVDKLGQKLVQEALAKRGRS